MGTAGETIPNLGYIISRIDREILQIMYMSQETETYNDWGEWSDLSHHLMGQTDDEVLEFGVALFNGLPQPWASGTEPDVDLADNRGLYGTATWNGALLAYSGPSPLYGGASLQVRLAALNDSAAQHDLRFRDIFYLNRYASDSEDRWFHTRHIDYKVAVFGNTFENVGDEEGLVIGAFFGAGHEHMGGTVKRTDLVGAFGGTQGGELPPPLDNGNDGGTSDSTSVEPMGTADLNSYSLVDGGTAETWSYTIWGNIGRYRRRRFALFHVDQRRGHTWGAEFLRSL